MRKARDGILSLKVKSYNKTFNNKTVILCILERMTMVEIREKTALLDRLELGNISIIGFNDIQNLINKEIVEVSSTKAKYVTASGQEFSRLKIEKDGLIDKMVAGSKILRNKRIDYCDLSMSIKNDKTGNLTCYTATEYFDQLLKIQNHLQSKYGIIADFSDITLKSVEINKTFKLDSNFEGYHRVLNLIMANLPTNLRNQMDYRKVTSHGLEYETYYATSRKTNKSKKYMLFKIYDKKKAIKNIIVLTDPYMRVEITLVGAERIKQSLGSNKFVDITDKLINDYFNELMQKIIVKPLEKWKTERNKHLLDLMMEQRKDKKHWQTNVLRILQNEEIANKCPTLLDIEELIPLLEELGLKPNRKCDVKRNLRKQAKKYESVFCNRDDLKLEEIVEKLTTIEPDITAIDTNKRGIQKIA